MGLSFNGVVRLVAMPEIRGKSKDGKLSLGTLRVACKKSFIKDENEDSDFFNLDVAVTEGQLKFLDKGKQIYVEGNISTDKYTSKTGEKRTAQRLKIRHFEFIGGSKAKDEQELSGSTETEAPAKETENPKEPW